VRGSHTRGNDMGRTACKRIYGRDSLGCKSKNCDPMSNVRGPGVDFAGSLSQRRHVAHFRIFAPSDSIALLRQRSQYALLLTANRCAKTDIGKYRTEEDG
jgi:hypothetical protein